uniref:Uncharacterized protein n=1 Tax=Pseudictyota dubia TaxID=2749911 RepID=A0A6U2JJJ5_9STRA
MHHLVTVSGSDGYCCNCQRVSDGIPVSTTSMFSINSNHFSSPFSTHPCPVQCQPSLATSALLIPFNRFHGGTACKRDRKVKAASSSFDMSHHCMAAVQLIRG